MCHDPDECEKAIAYWDTLYAEQAKADAEYRAAQAQQQSESGEEE